MAVYSVRILRSYDESYVDLEVVARNKTEAASKALKEATVNASLWFEDTPDPTYRVDPSMDPEKV